MEESAKLRPSDVTLRYQYEGDTMSLEWWQKNIMYHVYLPSFKDSNDDGIGDFQGLISKLEYFEELNIKTLLLSPFYPSPKKDNGYDISSYIGIDPVYGSMDDFESFMLEIKRRDMNVIIDLVANHTSDQHQWFQKSVKKEEPYTNYYVWVDKKPSTTKGNVLPPNNWLSVFGGSAWTWNEDRKQFYLHQFLPEQPDLNFRNAAVVDEIKKVMAFWLEKGIDGFRIDAASHLVEDENLRDEPVCRKCTKANPDEHAYLEHVYTKGLKENFDLLKEFRNVLDMYADKTGKSKIMVTEVFEEIEDVMNYYGDVGDSIADFPFNFQLYKVKSTSTGVDIYSKIDIWLSNMPKGKYPNWVLSSHDDPRVISRVGRRLASSLQIITMLLPGLPICYYGDEIGMENTEVKAEEIKDSFALRTCFENSRDPMRTPMQWNKGKCAGFTDFDKPWLPINENYDRVNVETERIDPSSFFNIFKYLSNLREEPTILVGVLEFPVVNEDIFSCLRFLVDAKCYLLVLNMNVSPICANLSNTSPFLPKEAVLELSNGHIHLSEVEDFSKESLRTLKCKCRNKNFLPFDYSTASSKNNCVKISLSSIHLQPKEAVILSFIGEQKVRV